MNKNGPILVIEDDADDQETLKNIFCKIDCKNELLFFNTGASFLEYLRSDNTRPFLVISDINLPGLNGFEIREALLANSDLKFSTIPYIYFSTSSSDRNIRKAFSLMIQGYFLKPTSYKDFERLMRSIIEYWSLCEAPL
jgi:CheY-like chemotaxis protein